MDSVGEDDIVVASTGYISREVFKYDRPLNFYMMGSMGCALAIGIGIALHVKQRVIVINGDGSVLMSLGTMVTLKKLQQERKISNLAHFILDNNSHESTGGQKTASDLINFAHLAKNTIVYKTTNDSSIPPRITLLPASITKRFKDALLRQQK
jgi:thiamine pyrophosphate-dependent acetolactate synthase large subunit-like protein